MSFLPCSRARALEIRQLSEVSGLVGDLVLLSKQQRVSTWQAAAVR